MQQVTSTFQYFCSAVSEVQLANLRGLHLANGRLVCIQGWQGTTAFRLILIGMGLKLGQES